MEYQLREPKSGDGVDIVLMRGDALFATNLHSSGNINDLIELVKSITACVNREKYSYKDKHGQTHEYDYNRT